MDCTTQYITLGSDAIIDILLVTEEGIVLSPADRDTDLVFRVGRKQTAFRSYTSTAEYISCEMSEAETGLVYVADDTTTGEPVYRVPKPSDSPSDIVTATVPCIRTYTPARTFDVGGILYISFGSRRADGHFTDGEYNRWVEFRNSNIKFISQ